ncbi:MAG: response regulator transcription factor [Chloroflexota bacterium]|nr:response regulator transcription factor [Chloroflexota bacterium]
MEKIRILLADDHTLFREGVRLLLERQSDMEVVGEAADGREAVELAHRLQPNVVLMDIGMPGMNGLEATRLIHTGDPAVRVLILTMHGTDDYFFRLLEAGASGYLLKEAAPTELLSAIRSVHNGEMFLYPSLAKRLAQEYLRRVGSGEEPSSYDSLTEREKEVLKLIGQGHTNQEIADILCLSINTVQTHRTHIMNKLNLHSRAELMKYALRFGLLSGDG